MRVDCVGTWSEGEVADVWCGGVSIIHLNFNKDI